MLLNLFHMVMNRDTPRSSLRLGYEDCFETDNGSVFISQLSLQVGRLVLFSTNLFGRSNPSIPRGCRTSTALEPGGCFVTFTSAATTRQMKYMLDTQGFLPLVVVFAALPLAPFLFPVVIGSQPVKAFGGASLPAPTAAQTDH